MEDATKPYDIFDDLESLLWVMLYVALLRFPSCGKGDIFKIFDEHSQSVGGVIGRKLTGGNSKKIWLSGNSPIMFESAPLNAFFTSFRRFHKEYLDKVKEARDENTKDTVGALERYKTEVEKDLTQLFSHFDDILQDCHIKWPSTSAPSAPNRPKTENEKDREIRDAVENWIGRLNDGEEHRPSVSPAQTRSLKASLTKRSSARYHRAPDGKKRAREAVKSPISRRRVRSKESTRPALTSTRVLRPRKH